MLHMTLTLKQFGNVNMGLKGSRSFGFSFSQSDLSWVFFEGDRSVEDDLKEKKKCTALHFISQVS